MQQSAESQEGFSLLYVEDEIETRMLLTSMIEHKYPSLKLHTARNGQEGIESYSQQLADIIVTDISMPYMNGLQMARKIRESNPEVMIIVLTARTDTQYLLDSIDIGINQYVLKPVDNKLLFSAIEKCVDSISLKRKVKEQNDFIAFLNDRLTARAKELEDINHELEAFNYTVSHELRTPLAIISGYSQVLTEMYGSIMDATCHDFINEISNGVETINKLIVTLLNFSSVNRSELDSNLVDLTNMAMEIATNLKKSGQSERKVDFRIMPGVTANGDKLLLKVLLENLLGNAWKYTGTTVEAVIELGLMEINKKPVYFVRDNGVGFDPNHADRMFAPFKRLDNCEAFEGTGIGLATVQRIVHKHGGDIWAQGEIGRGATFYFTLQADTARIEMNDNIFCEADQYPN